MFGISTWNNIVYKGKEGDIMNPVIIIPYFGKFPNYFNIFLLSCKYNKKFTWMIFTDNEDEFDWPDNVKKIKMSFYQCQNLIISKFDFKVRIDNVKKLCDYKVAYGYIFSEYISEFSHWGFGDLDLIYGDLEHFISDEMLIKFDKIYSLGHLSIYKNYNDNNMFFMTSVNGIERYREVFSNKENEVFDEWTKNSINEIYLKSDKNFYLDNDCADISPYSFFLTPTSYSINKKQYENHEKLNHIFKWDNGQLFDLYKSGSTLKEKEVPYIHMQKRKMKVKLKNHSNFFILPNQFINSDKNIIMLLFKSMVSGLLSLQFFRVKYNHMMIKIKRKFD